MDFSLSKIFSRFKPDSNENTGKVVGIDVGSAALKVVEIEKRKGVLTLTTYGELQLGPYAEKELGEAVQLEPEPIKNALIDIMRESAVRATRGVFAMPLSSSFVTIMQIETGEGQDVSSRIRVEARKYIPVPINDVTLDWAELTTSSSDNANVHDVLLAAIQNDALSAHQALMKSVSMAKQPTEIESFSAVRSLYVEGDGSVGTIDLGGQTSKLYVTDQGLIQRMHRVRAGGAMVTKRLAELLEIPFAEAELLKRDPQQVAAAASDVRKVLATTYERPLMEFKRVLDQYERSTDQKISRMELTGGMVLLPGTQQLIEEVLQRKTELADPFAKLAYPAFMEDTLKQIGPLFSVALGAALRAYE